MKRSLFPQDAGQRVFNTSNFSNSSNLPESPPARMDASLITDALQAVSWMAEKFGVAGAVLVVLLVLGVVIFWRVSTWVAPRVDEIAKAHVKLVHTASDTLPQISAAAVANARSMEILVDSQTNGKSALKHLSKAIEEVPECEDRRKNVKTHTENAREALE